MRFSTASLLALPVLATAANVDSPLDQAKAQLNAWSSYLSSFIPSPNAPHTPDAAAAKVGGSQVYPLNLDNWEETLRSKSKPGSVAPEQWYIFMTGGNKTCFGRCGQAETAFNETAAIWALDPTAPHLAYINCDSQPVLCNSWAAGPPGLWVFNVAPRPYASDLHIVSINTTSTTVQTFQDVRTTESWREIPKYEGYFHPFDGQIALLGASKPVGYFFWVFNVVPNWLFMMVISFVSRSFLTNKSGVRPRPAPAAAPAAAAPRVNPGGVRR